MSAWDAPDGTPNIFSIAAAAAATSPDARSVYDGFLCSVNRIILRDSERFACVPNKLSATMVGAVKAMCGRVVDSVETRYSQWPQYVFCAVQAVARRSRVATAKPLAVAPIRAARRLKAFFVSQKVNDRNAP